MTPKLIPIPADDRRTLKAGWPEPGEFSIRNSGTTPNFWEVVRKQDGVVYVYLEWDQGKKVLRVYRAEPNAGADRSKQFGAKQQIPPEPNGQQLERLDRRGNRFLSYFHLIQLDKKTFISMGLNQALGQSGVGKKTAGIVTRRGTISDPFFRSTSKLLNYMADLRLVSKPATWSIKLDKVYTINRQTDADSYKAVPDKAFAGTPISPGTVNGAEYIGLKCKYTNFEIQVSFTAATAEIELHESGDFAILEDLKNKQVDVTRAYDRFINAQSSASRNKSDLSSAVDARRAQGISNQFRITQDLRGATAYLTQRKGELDDFIADNKTLADLRDTPEVTTALVAYYRSIKATTGLAVSLEISRRQTIDGQVVQIPFWYPVIP